MGINELLFGTTEWNRQAFKYLYDIFSRFPNDTNAKVICEICRAGMVSNRNMIGFLEQINFSPALEQDDINFVPIGQGEMGRAEVSDVVENKGLSDAEARDIEECYKIFNTKPPETDPGWFKKFFTNKNEEEK